jgi:hypothetical protein
MVFQHLKIYYFSIFVYEFNLSFFPPDRLGDGPPLTLPPPPPGRMPYPESLCESWEPSDEHAVPVGVAKNLPDVGPR